MAKGAEGTSSTRLTEAVRTSIARDMLRHRFGKEVERLIDQGAALARAVYDDLYKGNDRKLLESLPAGWLQVAGALKVLP